MKRVTFRGCNDPCLACDMEALEASYAQARRIAFHSAAFSKAVVRLGYSYREMLRHIAAITQQAAREEEAAWQVFRETFP